MSSLLSTASRVSRILAGGAVGFTLGSGLYRTGPGQAAQAEMMPSSWTKCTVVASEPCGPDTKLISVQLPSTVGVKAAPVWSVFIKDDDIQVERPYTPLEGVTEHGTMSFWIKKYATGEVGRWLHAKSVGDNIDIRGPLQTWQWDPNAWDDVIMVNVTQLLVTIPSLYYNPDIRRNWNYPVLPAVSKCDIANSEL